MMKKMTWDEWKLFEQEKRELASKRSNNSKPPSADFVYDEELKDWVFVGYSNEVKH
jgi:hypothetical protein